MERYSKKKKLVFVTGTRADFGKLQSLIRAALNSKNFEVHIFATGMHMMRNYGYTVNEIKKHRFPNIHKYINNSGRDPMDAVLARTVNGIGGLIRRLEPDMMIVHGDRVEALGGAIAGALNNTLVAHVEGGEISGTIDEHIRHAVSKMSHVHFVANNEARRRLIQMGEEDESIFVVGSPDVDLMNSTKLPTVQSAKKRYGITFDKYAILLYHAVTTETKLLRGHVHALIEAVSASDMNYIVIGPNSDLGTDIIKNAYERYLRPNNRFKLFDSLRFGHFLTLLRNSNFIIGNSSAGVREAPYYGVPSINLGTRQSNRLRGAACVFNCDYNKNDIARLVSRFTVKHELFKPVQPFGDGNSAKKFIKIICTDAVWHRDIQKQFKDVELL